MKKVNRGDYCRAKPYCDSKFAVTRQVCWECDEFCPLFPDVDPRRLHELMWPRKSKTDKQRQSKAATSQQPPPTPTIQSKAAIGQIKTAPGQGFSTHFKACSKCKEKLPADLDSFPKERKGKNGLRSICRQCTREYQREYQREWQRKKSRQAKRPEDGRAGAVIDQSDFTFCQGADPAENKAVQDPAGQPAKNKLALRSNPLKTPRQDTAGQPTQDTASQPTQANNTKRLEIDFTLKVTASWRTLTTPLTEKQTSCRLKKDVQPDAFNLNTDDAVNYKKD